MNFRSFDSFALIRGLAYGGALMLAARAADFLLFSLHWPLAICLDASILRFESWSMLRGIWPWRDIVSINLPVTHYLHALGLVLFGADDAAFRLYDATWIVGTALLTGIYLLRYSRLAAAFGCALVLGLPVEATPYGAFQREILMLPFWLLSLWLAEILWINFASEPEKNGRTKISNLATWAVFGVLGVLGLAIKPTSVLLHALFVAALLYRAWRARRAVPFAPVPALLPGLAIAALAGLTTVMAICAPLALASPELPLVFVRSWINQTGAYAAVTETVSPLRLLLGLFSVHPGSWTLALNQPLDGPTDTGHLSLLHPAVFGLWFLFARRRTRPPFVGLMGLAALLQYLAQMRGFQYHLYPLWYAWALALSIVIGALIEYAGQRNRPGPADGRFFFGRRAAFVAGLVALALVASALAVQTNALGVYRGTGLYAPGHSEDVPRFRTPERIGALVARKKKNGPVLLQTFEHATIALGAVIPNEMRLASRYPVDYILWKPSAYRAPARADLMRSLARTPPDIIAYAAGHDEAERARLATFPELARFMADRYGRTDVVNEINGDEYWIFVRTSRDRE